MLEIIELKRSGKEKEIQEKIPTLDSFIETFLKTEINDLKSESIVGLPDMMDNWIRKFVR